MTPGGAVANAGYGWSTPSPVRRRVDRAPVKRSMWWGAGRSRNPASASLFGVVRAMHPWPSSVQGACSTRKRSEVRILSGAPWTCGQVWLRHLADNEEMRWFDSTHVHSCRCRPMVGSCYRWACLGSHPQTGRRTTPTCGSTCCVDTTNARRQPMRCWVGDVLDAVRVRAWRWTMWIPRPSHSRSANSGRCLRSVLMQRWRNVNSSASRATSTNDGGTTSRCSKRWSCS